MGRARRVEFLCLAAAVCVALKLVWDVSQVHDLHFDDETLYLASGVRVFHPGYPNGANGLPAPDWGPLYCWWYALLHLFQRDTVRLYYLNWSALVVLGAISFYALARAIGASALASLLAAFLLTTSDFFEVWPYPAHFATLLLCAGLAVAARSPTRSRALFWATGSMLVCCWVRPEFVVAAALVVACAIFRAVRPPAPPAVRARRALALLVPLAALGALLCTTMGFPVSQQRAFYAWGQHYAFHRVQDDHSTTSPWRSWLPFVRRDFGNARSVAGALRANPAAFLHEVLENAEDTPIETSRTFAPGLCLPEGVRPTLRDLQSSGVFLAFAWAMRALWRRRREVALSILAVAVGTAASCLGVYPRSHYLLPVVALAVCASVTQLPRIPAVSRHPGRVAIAAAVLVLLAPNLAHGWCPQTLLGMTTPAPSIEVERTVESLRALVLPRESRILEPGWGYAFYAGYEYAPIEEWRAGETFVDFVRRRRITAVILNDAFALDPRFGGDPTYVALRRDPEAFGFRAVDVPGTQTRIVVREGVMASGS
ncbi:MAG TPA: hypothetical protein VGG39_09240 [Polyangiaceae bacterium]|jgi:hypothetical protein